MLLASAVGIIGAGVSLAYHLLSQLIKWVVFQNGGDISEIAIGLAPPGSGCCFRPPAGCSRAWCCSSACG